MLHVSVKELFRRLRLSKLMQLLQIDFFFLANFAVDAAKVSIEGQYKVTIRRYWNTFK